MQTDGGIMYNNYVVSIHACRQMVELWYNNYVVSIHACRQMVGLCIIIMLCLYMHADRWWDYV